MSEDTLHYIGHRQRLRERFLQSGGAGLHDYEVLELALFAAKPRGDVKPLAKRLLKQFGSLSSVVNADINELKKVDEVGDAAIVAIKTMREFAERLLKETVAERHVLQSWDALLDYCRVAMANEKVEQFRILFLNHKNTLIADEVLQKGTVNHTPVYPREVVKRALELGASALILVHNHPSGDPTPSKPDISMTQKIVSAASGVSIEVHDHLIIAGKGHYSFKSHGLM